MGGDGTSLLGVIFGNLECTKAFNCPDSPFDQYGGIALWLALMLYMFKALGTICDEYFVPALEVIVEKLDISNDVAGATFMAAGSSAPELFTSLVATFLIVNEGGVGTIVGSAIFNILVIVGLTGYAACQERDLPIWWYPLSRDCAFYLLAVIELVIFLKTGEEVSWYEGVIMIATYASYIGYMKFNPRIVSYFDLQPPEKSGDASECESPGLTDAAASSETWEDPIQKVTIQPTNPTIEVTDICDSVDVVGVHSKVEPSDQVFAQLVADTGSSVPSSVASSVAPSVAPSPCASMSMLDLTPTSAADAGIHASERSSASEPKMGGNETKSPIKWSMKRSKTHGDGLGVASASESRSSSKEKSRRSSSKEPARSRSNSKEASGSPASARKCSKDKVEVSLDTVVPEPQVQKAPVEVQETTAPLEEAEVKPPKDVVYAFGSEDRGGAPNENCDEPLTGFQRWCRDPLTLLMELIMPNAERHCAALFTLSILFIGFSTYLMVDATNRIGTILKAPPLFMGRIFLAAGTSIPDAMGSIAVAKQGEGDMAVANSLGSNVFDILVGLGVPWTLRCMMGQKVEFHGKIDNISVDIAILVGVLFLLLGALIVSRWRLTKKVGYILIIFYGFYIFYNIAAVWIFKIERVEDD